MSKKQCALLKKVVKEKNKQKSKTIVLSKEDIQQIGVSDLDRLEESRISFEEI